jgi:hypothetical protein
MQVLIPPDLARREAFAHDIQILFLRARGRHDFEPRSCACVRACTLMPRPLSCICSSCMPPPFTVTTTLVACASREFSSSSLSAALGRCTTSPAAMRFTVASSSLLMRCSSCVAASGSASVAKRDMVTLCVYVCSSGRYAVRALCIHSPRLRACVVGLLSTRARATSRDTHAHAKRRRLISSHCLGIHSHMRERHRR